MNGWSTVALSEVAQVFNGKTPSKSEQRESGHPVLKIRDVSELGRFRGPFGSFVDESLAATYSSKKVQRGDTLILNAAHNADYVGSKTFYAEPAVYGSLATGEWLIIRPDPKALDAGFVHQWVRLDLTRQKIREVVNGIHLYPKDVARLKLALPPLPEQRRIAAILDQVDTLRAKRREALAQLDSLTQSIFIEMFGDPVKNSKCWPTIKLGEHTSKMGSGATPLGGDAAYKASGISLIRSLNVRDGVFAYKDLAYIDDAQAAKLSNVIVCEGDVLLNITGASVARVCRAPIEVLPARVNQHVMIIRPKSTVDSVFLERMLLSPNMKRLLLQIGGSGATREAITKAQAAELMVICPPIALQQTFASRIQAVDSLKALHRAALADSDVLFAALQHRAFAGQL